MEKWILMKKRQFWETNFTKLRVSVAVLSILLLIPVYLYKTLINNYSERGISAGIYLYVLYYVDFFSLLICFFYTFNFLKIKKTDPSVMGKKKFIVGLLPSALCFIISIIITII